MSAHPSPRDATLRREVLVIAALTGIGTMLRVWSIGRLGLVHFDEGIYAIAGLWVLSPRGLADLDPTTLAYAPPGFPFLIGLSYTFLGVRDLSAIVVSILAGALTVPTAAWLAHRTFGRGAGAAAAALTALSGPHIAFSRMALTDACFLLTWLLATILGQRFLERPGPWRAILLGLTVGAAQLVKYNGWIAGVLVAVSATVGMLSSARARGAGLVVATWGWGLLAATIAALVYWPWFRYVEAHGGYAALLAHQRSYLGGFGSWPGHLGVQLAEARALSGGLTWRILAGLTAVIGMRITRGRLNESQPWARRAVQSSLLALVGAAGILGQGFFLISWWLTRTPAKEKFAPVALIGIGWIGLILLTPCYHPYARLWLPIEAFGWILLAGGFVAIGVRGDSGDPGRGPDADSARRATRFRLMVASWLVVFVGIFPARSLETLRITTLLEPTDSLRLACRRIAADLPRDVKVLRVYARPPVRFYLAGTVPLAPQPSLAGLLAPAGAATWGLLDAAMLRQEGQSRPRSARFEDHWVLAREEPSQLNWPTLLDIDPAAAIWDGSDRSTSLQLLRPKPAGDVR